MQTTPHDIS